MLANWFGIAFSPSWSHRPNWPLIKLWKFFTAPSSFEFYFEVLVDWKPLKLPFQYTILQFLGRCLSFWGYKQQLCTVVSLISIWSRPQHGSEQYKTYPNVLVVKQTPPPAPPPQLLENPIEFKPPPVSLFYKFSRPNFNGTVDSLPNLNTQKLDLLLTHPHTSHTAQQHPPPPHTHTHTHTHTYIHTYIHTQTHKLARMQTFPQELTISWTHAHTYKHKLADIKIDIIQLKKIIESPPNIFDCLYLHFTFVLSFYSNWSSFWIWVELFCNLRTLHYFFN